MELEFVNGVQQGKEVHYYANGQRRGIIDFLDGVKHGDMHSWYPDGKFWA